MPAQAGRLRKGSQKVLTAWDRSKLVHAGLFDEVNAEKSLREAVFFAFGRRRVAPCSRQRLWMHKRIVLRSKKKGLGVSASNPFSCFYPKDVILEWPATLLNVRMAVRPF
jgi:hypothetical protein